MDLDTVDDTIAEDNTVAFMYGKHVICIWQASKRIEIKKVEKEGENKRETTANFLNKFELPRKW